MRATRGEVLQAIETNRHVLASVSRYYLRGYEEDILQEVRIKILTVDEASLPDAEQVFPWLWSVVRNRALSARRSEWRHRRMAKLCVDVCRAYYRSLEGQ